MGRFVCLWLTASCILLTANSQVVPQNQNVLNPDHIYFTDNRPNAGKSVNRTMNPPSVELQPPYNVQDQIPMVSNLVETSTNNRVPQKPENGLNIAQQPIFAQSVIPNRNSQEVQTPVYDQIVNLSRKNNLPRVRFDQTTVALTNFSINVMKNIMVQSQGNSIVSPYSVATVLALLQQGASQQALEQISAALQMSAETSTSVYKSHTQDILGRNSRNILRTANNLFVADAFTFNPQFREVAQRDFNSDVTPTIFNQPDQSARFINSWVASKTNNKIDKLISADAISANTQMVLVNAIYFKGLWAVPFRAQSTKVDTFTLLNGVVKKVPIMMIRHNFRAGIDAETEAKVVVLPFEREEYSMMIILPSPQSSVRSTLTSLTVSQLENYLNFKRMEVALQLPKFTIKADTDLTPVLKQLGVTQIFEQSSGLVGLGMYRTFTPQVSSAVHSALLSIDEEGSVAAAASAFTVVALSNDEPSISIKVDRPFVVVLWDEKTKVPLFMGKIEDPSLK